MRTPFVVVYLSLLGCEIGSSDKVHGVNYGGRFVPEYYLHLPGTEDILWKDIKKNEGASEMSLCDVGSADKQERMTQFLDLNIKEEHFHKMASFGFNVVRLPLGYWNLIDLPANTTPSGPWRHRWMNLQELQPSAKSYMKWIDQIFQYAQSAGLQVLLDFHSAPGGQIGNQDTGCDLGVKNILDLRKIYTPGFFDHEWNFKLGVQGIEALARLCASKGSVCWGIELLNEPYGPLPKSVGPLPDAGIIDSVAGRAMLSRDRLQEFYLQAIPAARKHISKDVPIVIMDWSYWLRNYWKSRANSTFSNKGKIVFSTHFYPLKFDLTRDLKSAKQDYQDDLIDAFDFTTSTGFELLVTEYALANHGLGDASDPFPYENMTQWLVEEMDHLAGEMVWNFDSKYNAWGPVEGAAVLGIPWGKINGLRPSPWYYSKLMIICISIAFASTIGFAFAWLRGARPPYLPFAAGLRPLQEVDRTPLGGGRSDVGASNQEVTAFLAADRLDEHG